MNFMNQIKTSIYNTYFLSEDAQKLYVSIRNTEKLHFILHEEKPVIHKRHYPSIFASLLKLAEGDGKVELLRYLQFHAETARHSLDFLWNSPLGTKERVLIAIAEPYKTNEETKEELNLTDQIFSTFFADEKETS